MSRLVTLLGYGVIAAWAVVLEVAARLSRRSRPESRGPATFGDVLDTALRPWPVRVVVLAGWLWLGWHLFARVNWR